ncbi:MAG: GTPase HflX [Anaerolineales bacterium]
MHEVAEPKEQGFLVGAQLKSQRERWDISDCLDELELLANTAGIEVVGRTYQYLEAINPATYIGPGKVEEIRSLRETLGYNVVIFDDELSPRQLRELEEALDVKILDRTSLILDIFAARARTHEGRLQVALAQYEYRLPRLTRAWTHLARQVGGSAGRGGIGGVGLRGPGETQLEVDRREILRRIAQLKHELDAVRQHREQYRRRREQANLPVVAIVGYTNAGKSTLLNTLAGTDLLAEDKLFATLDPTTRRIALPGGQAVLFTDTVGFIRKLPTMLVAAFRATLEEIADADLLLHVVDVSHKNVLEHLEEVDTTLREIGAHHIPVLTALNKIDRLADPQIVNALRREYQNAIPISAKTGQGIDDLLRAVARMLSEQWVTVEANIPYTQGEIVALFHERGVVEREEHQGTGTHIVGRIPRWLLASVRPYL